MSLNLDNNPAQFQIQGYDPGQIQINEKIYTHSLIVAPNAIQSWPPETLAELQRKHFDLIISLHPQILLVGTGAQFEFPPLEVYGDLLNEEISVELMDTRAACRTYNILTAEGRNVLAALLIR